MSLTSVAKSGSEESKGFEDVWEPEEVKPTTFHEVYSDSEASDGEER